MQFTFAFNERDFAQLERNIRQADDIIAAQITGEGCKEMAEIAANEARSIVQIDTGKTQASIRVRGVTEEVAGRRVANSAYYIFAGTEDHRAALFLELGTINMRPYPFLRPAVQRTYDAQYKGFVNAVKRGFRRLGSRIKGAFRFRR